MKLFGVISPTTAKYNGFTIKVHSLAILYFQEHTYPHGLSYFHMDSFQRHFTSKYQNPHSNCRPGCTLQSVAPLRLHSVGAPFLRWVTATRPGPPTPVWESMTFVLLGRLWGQQHTDKNTKTWFSPSSFYVQWGVLAGTSEGQNYARNVSQSSTQLHR